MHKRTPFLAATVLAVVTAATALAQDMPIVVDPAIETMSVDQLIEARHSAMKENGRLVRNAIRANGGEAVAAATTMLQNFTNLPSLFPEGSTGADSKALPVIWQNWEDFRGRFDEDARHAQKALEAAKAGDSATYAAELQSIAQSCRGCHQMYRS